MNNKKLINFFFELGQMRRVKHEGWRVAGVNTPESIADHSLRAGQIAYFLAKMEKYPKPLEVCGMLLFHDIGECRIGDLHKIAIRYVTSDEERAVKDQMAPLGMPGKEVMKMWQDMEKHHTKAGIIAKDADYLEQAVTAKEYMEKGHKFAADWIHNVSKRLKTASAKKLLKDMEKVGPHDWCEGLKMLDK
ncbi:HD domain-containing protein [Candidatus Peregrinibacteria bacterium]|nr:HD domain-containing protein [Candidatus Peregrinibacteria bacterium]